MRAQDGSRLAITEQERDQPEWTGLMELVAQLIEEVSILAADMRRKKPITIPRPNHIKAPRHAGGGPAGRDPYKQAVSVLAATTPGAARAA